MFSCLQITISTAATVALFAAAEMASTSSLITNFNDNNNLNKAGVIGGHYNIIPPFNINDSKLVSKCAVIAQHKRQHQNLKKNLTAINSLHFNNPQIHALPLIQELTNDVNESYLNGLPINQAK